MQRRQLLAGLAAGAVVESACRAEDSRARFTKEVVLPKPNVAGTASLEDVLQRRRSLRFFRPDPVPLANIGQLFWAGQGITNPNNGRRTAPSAGASFALELYAVTATEVMHYLPNGHKAETRTAPDLRPELRALALDQQVIRGCGQSRRSAGDANTWPACSTDRRIPPPRRRTT